jgi:hypothetical protein
VGSRGAERTRQNYVDITYKLARTAVRQLPCTNTLSFAPHPPAAKMITPGPSARK